MAPSYIKKLLTFYVSKRENMRSSSKMSLQVPKTKLVTAGDVCFSVAAPKLWNDIPESLKNAVSLDVFKTHLKTYLFGKAFSDKN